MNISILVIGKHPLSDEELDLWNHANEGDWQRFHDLFVVEVTRELEGARFTRDIVTNDEARARLMMMEATPSTNDGLE